MAVGQSSYISVAETFANGTWVASALPKPAAGVDRNELLGVSCAATTRCVAVGSIDVRYGSAYQGLVETMAGGLWAAASKQPAGPAYATTNGISCPDDQHCTAIGSSIDRNNAAGLMTETRAADTWASASLTLPSPDYLSPSGVTCPAPGSCVVTGRNYSTRGYFAATQAGTTWTITALPLPTEVAQQFDVSAPSCPAVGRCVVVLAYYDNASNEMQSVAETLAGGTWTTTTLPVPPDTDSGHFAIPAAVSCATPTWCAYVGSYNNSTTGGALYGGTLVDGSWTATTIDPSDTVGGDLASISCPTIGTCTAVGRNSSNASNAWKPLQVTLSSGTWSGGSLPIPPEVQNESLAAVSCLSVDRCVAVGVQTLAEGGTHAIVDTLGGGSGWSSFVLADPVGGQLGELLSMSCQPATCYAVGDARTADGGLKPFSSAIAAPEVEVRTRSLRRVLTSIGQSRKGQAPGMIRLLSTRSARP